MRRVFAIIGFGIVLGLLSWWLPGFITTVVPKRIFGNSSGGQLFTLLGLGIWAALWGSVALILGLRLLPIHWATWKSGLTVAVCWETAMIAYYC